MEYILSQLKNLTAIPSPTGYTIEAARYVIGELTRLGFSPRLTNKGCVICTVGGEGNPVLVSAHLDTLGGMVAEVKGNGRLRLTRVGGLQANNVETENAVVITRFGKTYTGCMQMNDPSAHVNTEYADQKRDFKGMQLVLDERVKSVEDVKNLGIATGDYVCFDPRTIITESGYIKSRFLDDKLSAAILLGLAKHVKENNCKLDRRIDLFFSVYEEVGHGCSSGFPEDIEEVLCVDMGCVGEGLACDEHQVSICAKDSSGPYDYETTTALIRIAKENQLDYAVDIYPSYGSDAGAALSAGADVRHALIGAGVYASHGYERSHVDGVKNTLKLLKLYLCKK